MSHVLNGKVVPGMRVGRTLGYPTANVESNDPAPSAGVYVACVAVDTTQYEGILVVGARQEAGRPLVEVLLLDFDGDLYGKTLTIEVQKHISDIERFETNEQLVKKIEEDIKKARTYFATH